MSTDVMPTDEKVTAVEAVDYPSDELDDLEAAAVEVREFQAETLDASTDAEDGGYAEDNVGGKVRLDHDRGRPMPRPSWLAHPEHYWTYSRKDNPQGWYPPSAEAAYHLYLYGHKDPSSWQLWETLTPQQRERVAELKLHDPSVLTNEMAKMGQARWATECGRYVGWGDLRKRQHPYTGEGGRIDPVISGAFPTRPCAVWNDGKRVDHPCAPEPWHGRGRDARGHPRRLTFLGPRCNDNPCEHGKPAGPKLRPHVWWESDRFSTPDDDDARAPSADECREYTAALVVARMLDYETWPRLQRSELVAVQDYLPVKVLADLGLVIDGEDDRETAKLAEGLAWVPHVRYKVAESGGEVAREWGVLFRPAPDITLRWQQLSAESDGRTDGNARATQDEAWRRLDDELRAAMILYYQSDPDRMLQRTYQDGTPIGGPALTVTALNAALTWRRNPPATVQSIPWDVEVLGEDNAPVAESLSDREQELYETTERMDEVGMSADDRATLFEWMRERMIAGALDRPVDWEWLAECYHVGSKVAAQTKVRRARDRLLGRAKAVMPPDHPALRRYEQERRLVEPDAPKRRTPTVKAILQSYGVDLSGRPNAAGWVSVRCPWHERDRAGGAGWHHAQDLYRCFSTECLLPPGEVLTAERLYLADEAA